MGIDVAGNPLAVQNRLGYMPQRFGLYEDLSVRENLDLYADLQGVPPEARAARYAELLHMTGLGPFTGRMAGQLSGGINWGWPAPWSIHPHCYCWTNPPWAWTRCPGENSGTSSIT